ncbi:hypothetical protein N0V93_006291 [Gnomoniopsis smithogilvyi]|uniref:Uncharacterized protein n=1 Tax=Gnomoniopsis smithogilvyi TaxID=1191159 RepID=A0A9W8YRM4_9PEZI|nr:hypothetical protein N0V93_006291 [Gnomoniopsis smithogilvyi]
MFSVGVTFPSVFLAGLACAAALERATFTSFSLQGSGASCSGADCTFNLHNTYGLNPGPPMISLEKDYILTWMAADPAFPLRITWHFLGADGDSQDAQYGDAPFGAPKWDYNVSGGASSGSYTFSPSVVLATGFPNPLAPNITDGTEALGYASQSFDLEDEKKYKFNYFAVSQPDKTGSDPSNFDPSDPFTIQPREAETIVRVEQERARNEMYHKWELGVGVGVGVGVGLPILVYSCFLAWRRMERRRNVELKTHMQS